MKVLMLGWEFPPVLSGGLGTACLGLTRALTALGTDVIFVVPHPLSAQNKLNQPPASLPPPSRRASELLRALEPAVITPQPAAPPPPPTPPAQRPPATSSGNAAPVRQSDQPVPVPPGWEPMNLPFPTSNAAAAGRLMVRSLDALLSPYLRPNEYLEVWHDLVDSRDQPPVPASNRSGAMHWIDSRSMQNAPPPPAIEDSPPFIPDEHFRSPWPAPSTSAPTGSAPWLSTTHAVPPAAHQPELPPYYHPHEHHDAPGAAARSKQPIAAAPAHPPYSASLLLEIQRYAKLVLTAARRETFDVIHAHDWMTFPAAVATARFTGKPLVVHVHSTELDRAGDSVNPDIYEIERAGMRAATTVICVSDLTRERVVTHYQIPREKVIVIHNGVDALGPDAKPTVSVIRPDEKVVLFLGRVTYQKGPDFFLAAAAKVLTVFKKVKFVVAGAGDLLGQMIAQAAELGIADHFLFTGFLPPAAVDEVFRIADLYVMPSASEPFGIAPLEAIARDVPVIISRQSGVSEVLENALKVDFGNVDELADKIVSVLRHPILADTLRQHARMEIRHITWDQAAKSVRDLYGIIEQEQTRRNAPPAVSTPVTAALSAMQADRDAQQPPPIAPTIKQEALAESEIINTLHRTPVIVGNTNMAVTVEAPPVTLESDLPAFAPPPPATRRTSQKKPTANPKPASQSKSSGTAKPKKKPKPK
jgi:glycosyltransferase involved in cell wall biosynthesis